MHKKPDECKSRNREVRRQPAGVRCYGTAPGADAKYRLGNEAETYGEQIFINNWLNPDHTPGKAWMRTEFLVEANTTNSANYANFPNGIGDDQFRFREAFVEAGNVLESQPDAKFWAGNSRSKTRWKRITALEAVEKPL